MGLPHDPREVLRGPNRILFRRLRDRFVCAAYLRLDTENCKASYSVAGGPVLWRAHLSGARDCIGFLLVTASTSNRNTGH